jgi:pimeloyl-ACP methyl ester carboxylesterase
VTRTELKPGIASRLGYAFLMPEDLRSRRLLVLVHGSRGSPEAMVKLWRDLSRRLGVALLAPNFGTPAFSGFQRLHGADGRFAASNALIRLVASVAAAWDLERERFDLLGFSGGAQFAHRFALLHPNRINALIAIAAGWYTELDEQADYPVGLRGMDGVQKDALAAVRTLVMVGEKDVERDKDFKRCPRLDFRQGVSRVERARTWFGQAEQLVGSNSRLLVVPGVGHYLRGLIDAGALTAAIAALEAKPLGELDPHSCAKECDPPSFETALRAVQ